MSTPVNLPSLGESVTEGTVTRWLKNVGDEVAVDEPLLEISTDKVDTEIPSPVAGTLVEINAEVDETVEVGAQLCVIGEAGEAPASGPSEDQAGSEEPAQESAPEAAPESTSESTEAPAEAPAASAPAPEPEPAPEPAAPAASSGSGEGTPVTLPSLGESVTEGTVTRWLKEVGDEVAVDEPLLEISTDKVDTEIPSPVAGTLVEIKAEVDETVEVGAELAIIGSAGAASAPAEEAPQAPTEQPAEQPADEPAAEAPPAEAPAPAPAEQSSAPAPADTAAAPAPAPSSPPPEAASTSSSQASSDGSYVTPLVRKLAAEHGVDLSSVKGSGVGGRIRKADVLAAAEAAKSSEPAAAPSTSSAPAAPTAEPSPLRGQTVPMTRLRKVIAERMVESLQISAQLTTVVEVDVTGVARLRESIKDDFLQREGVKLSFMPFFAKAAIDCLKAHPSLNAGIDTEKGEITYYDHENLAIAVDTERGLLTPVIKEAGDLSIAGLAKRIADLAERTRDSKIGPDELAGGTFTLTNTGSRGALFDTPIINQPQVAILGTGSVVKRPVVVDDPVGGESIAVRDMVYLALTYDHRLVDGADAARFLTDVKTRLESAQFDV